MGKILETVGNVFRSALEKDGNGKKYFNSAVILAAGSGSRFDSERKKQFVEIDGVPVVVRSAKVFNDCDFISEIVVVTVANEVDGVRRILEAAGITKLTKVVAGGATRQESSRIGFDNVNPMCDFAAIHDGARCLVTEEMIRDTFTAAYSWGAACAAEKVVDTVKRADVNGMVKETLDRREIWLAKTPQTFKADVYRAASYTAMKDGFEGTDDVSLAEHCGFKVKLVDCGTENIKLTYPEDEARMREILERRRREY
ncbi:MAG: 2-C-methyl-D-erythritol 4-phosphate cytidylyltransferase [Ruminococcaceae bacterium]|nr:2-C-methyl-D-erythritol 4-phosphate cytidylyltransferase [Oscillospiraceae bacterium]